MKLKAIKILLLTISLIIIFNQIKNDYHTIIEVVILNSHTALILLFIVVIFHNLINLRYFFFLRLTFDFKNKFNDWTKLFFFTAFLNNGFSFSGHVLRAIELKKSGIRYKDYIGMQYLLLGISILVNLYLVLIESFFLIDLTNFFFIILFLSLFINFFFTSYFLIFSLNLIKNIFLLKKLYQLLSVILKIIKIKKNIFIFVLFTILIHFFEIIIFYLSCKIFIEKIDVIFVLKLFMLNYFIHQLPIFSLFAGFREIVFGSLGFLLGFTFLEGILIQLLIRIVFNISFIFNYSFYSFFKKINKLFL